MKINWKLRLKSKKFWVTIIPAIAIVIQTAATLFEIDLDLSHTVATLVDLVNAVFVVLIIGGIVIDPTTPGIGDSERVLEKDKIKDQ